MVHLLELVRGRKVVFVGVAAAEPRTEQGDDIMRQFHDIWFPSIVTTALGGAGIDSGLSNSGTCPMALLDFLFLISLPRCLMGVSFVKYIGSVMKRTFPVRHVHRIVVVWQCAVKCSQYYLISRSSE